VEKKKWKKILNAVFVAVIFAVTLITVFQGENFREVLHFLTTAETEFVLPSIALVILFIMGESVVICYLFRTLGIKAEFFRCCLYSFIGFFYSCVTPSASGGQRMQVIAMKKDKIPVASSTVVLAIVTITYKLVLVLSGLAVLLIRPEGIMKYLEPVETIMYVGLTLNLICIAILLNLVFYPKTVRSFAEWGLALWNRIRPSKHPEKQKERLEGLLSQYTGTAEYFKTHKHVILHVLLITFVQRYLLFFITWLTYCAFELSGEGMPVIVTLQAMISVASDMLPLPGGMGVSENLFLVIFEPVFGEDLVLPGMVISRGISYYSQMIISGIMTLAATLFISKEKGEE
jgi:uncharacterized protein (TIRG00374 family)